MTSRKKVCTTILGKIFIKSNNTQRFHEPFHKFYLNFYKFFPDFILFSWIFTELDCPLSSLWTILQIDIKSPAKSDGMLDWASVRWAFVFIIIASCLPFVAFSKRRTLSIPAPQGGVRYREPLKHVRPGCVRTPSVWDWSLNHGKDGDCNMIDFNSAPDESAKESSYFCVHGSHL